jgi:hypothetical protein
MRAFTILAMTLSIFRCGPAQAWWDEGHMQIAYIAYTKLTPAVKDRADALLKLNPDYATWIAGAPVGKDAFSASSRMFDLDGEASTARTKQISEIIGPSQPILSFDKPG